MASNSSVNYSPHTGISQYEYFGMGSGLSVLIYYSKRRHDTFYLANDD